MNVDALVRPGRMGKALAKHLTDRRWLDLEAEMITGGKSNLTFRLRSSAGELILRRPPTGKLLPRAHDMAREVRVQEALRQSDVPVAAMVLTELEPGLLDVPFYVMECLPGLVLRDEMPHGLLGDTNAAECIAHSVVDTLAALHSLDAAELGLADFGRPDLHAERLVLIWWRQFRAAKTRDIPAVAELYRRLAKHPWPPLRRPSVVHGDYRLDNCLVEVDGRPQVSGVLDWELSTLGDPLCDLGTFLFYWIEVGEEKPLLTPALTASAGFPSRREMAERYSLASGRSLEDLDAYIALAHFKFVGIAQGLALRVARGQMAGQDFGNLDTEIERIAAKGLDVMKN